MRNEFDRIVIGGGASGLMAAITAAQPDEALKAACGCWCWKSGSVPRAKYW